jgi:hypothetical protein
MKDEQWFTLTARLEVPAKARAAIENELDLYARVAAVGTAPRPNEVRGKLAHAAKLAADLLEAIEEFGLEEHDALCANRPVDIEAASEAAELAVLVGHPGATPRLDALKLLAEQHAQLIAIRDSMTTAAATVARGKTRDASNVRALVRRVSEIIETHAGKSLSKGKREFDFALELCKLADPDISLGSVKGAIESLTAKKLACENSANSG